MPLYEERLSNDLSRIRDEVADLGAAVQTAQVDAVEAALSGDRSLANHTILGDHPINRKTIEINRLCHAFLATHLPTAGHLRVISSILRLVNELERIGDYAATIAREGLQLPHLPSGHLRREMEEMAEQAKVCLQQAMKSFNERDAELARQTKSIAAQSKSRGDMAFEDLVKESETSHEQIRYLFDVLILIGRLKRICDRCKNICEETLFTVTGETKPPKAYKILFLDQNNNCQSRIAQALAGKRYPNSGEYESAGRHAGVALDTGLIDFLEERGLPVDAAEGIALPPDLAEIGKFDVVVSLQGPMSDYVRRQPFRTVFLDWDVGEVPDGLDEADRSQRYMEIFREVSVRLRDLIETLRGEGAD